MEAEASDEPDRANALLCRPNEATSATEDSRERSTARARFSLLRPLCSLGIVAITVAIAIIAGHRLSIIFSAIGGTVGSALVAWLPAALLAADARALLRRGAARGRVVGRLSVAAGLAVLGVMAFA
eukprot:1477954-Prymnesium_polylepis.1